jgi:hypothetical protein
VRRGETSIGGADVRFRNTSWTIVLRARASAKEALGELIRVYWKPVYFFVRRRGNAVEQAKDLTQSFFTFLLERDFLKSVSPDKGLIAFLPSFHFPSFVNSANHGLRLRPRRPPPRSRSPSPRAWARESAFP